MKLVLLLATLALAGCGTSIGQSLGLTTAGSATVKITHVSGEPCPDAEAQGSVPLQGLDAYCRDGQHEEHISLQSSDPTALVTENNKILAGVIGTLAGAAAGGPAGALAGGLLNGAASSPGLGQPLPTKP